MNFRGFSPMVLVLTYIYYLKWFFKKKLCWNMHENKCLNKTSTLTLTRDVCLKFLKWSFFRAYIPSLFNTLISDENFEKMEHAWILTILMFQLNSSVYVFILSQYSQYVKLLYQNSNDENMAEWMKCWPSSQYQITGC